MATQGRRRALGQHFLRDQSIAQLIAETALEEAKRSSCNNLLEIGPGQGAITHPILEKMPDYPSVQHLLLIEKDIKLGEKWKEEPALKPFRVEIGDFLDLPNNLWLPAGSLTVVSNLPYSVGTAIFVRLASHFEKIPAMVLMFQAEVAQRLRAEPSTKDRGSLSIWTQNRWEVRKLMTVPPRAFTPPPKVDSEVVVLTRREKPIIEITPELEDFWEKFLKTTFNHRRKMLRSSLPWRNALELSGVDGTKRAEALQWDEWDRLFQATLKVVKASS